jgi:probable rRNA maturation factor
MPQGLAIDIVVKSPLWGAQPAAEPILRRALCAAAAAVSTKPAELAIVLTDDSAVRLLNRDWRSIDEPTNVLSFPMSGLSSESGGERAVAQLPILLGDIVIAYETTAAEARLEAKPFCDHLAHLAVHGFLHLLGYDHGTDADAERMEGLERCILARLHIPDPYAARDLSGAAGPNA